MNTTQALAKLLQTARENPAAAAGAASSLQGGGIRLRRYAAGQPLAHTGQPLRNVMVLLQGRVSVLKYTREGGVARSGVSAAVQIYGLYELLVGIEAHTATLQAEEDVLCAELSPKLYERALRESHAVALHSLYFLARFTDRMLNRNDRLALNTPYQNLLLSLYDAATGQPLPFTLPGTKAEMAESLGMNLRTLYRQLNRLERQGLLVRHKGKIQVDLACYRKIERAIAVENSTCLN